MNDFYKDRDQFYLKPSGGFVGLIFASLILGLVVLGYGFATMEGKTVWGAYLFNLFFFFCLGLGGLAMSAIQDVVAAVWARPIKRIWEAFGFFVPVAAVMFFIFFLAIKFDILGAREVYSWIHNPDIVHHFWGKNVWLSENFFLLRGLFILSVLSILSMWQVRQSLKRDLKFVEGDRDSALQIGEETRVKLNFWSGGLLVVYGVSLTFFGIDVIKSLSPLWFSTLFGGWQFAIMMQTLFATTLIIMFALKESKIGSVIYKQQFHDVGKLLFGFTVFFGYTTFAHVLTYWYGNMPEETEYYIHRLHGPWLTILWFVFFAAFVIPMYSLVFKSAKWTWWAAIPIAAMVLLAQWTTNLVLVMPEVSSRDGAYLPLAELGGFLFFFGLFFLTFITVGKRVPMVGLADPLLPKGIELSRHHHG